MSIKRRIGVCLTAICLAVQAGCVNPFGKKVVAPLPPQKTDEQILSERIAASALEIQKNMELLARLSQQDAIAANKLHVPPRPKSPALTNPMPFDFEGPVELAVRHIAHSIGWTFQSSGKRPIQPVIVRIRSSHSSVYDILQSCGDQVGKFAAVQVNEDYRTIKVIYLPYRNG